MFSQGDLWSTLKRVSGSSWPQKAADILSLVLLLKQNSEPLQTQTSPLSLVLDPISGHIQRFILEAPEVTEHEFLRSNHRTRTFRTNQTFPASPQQPPHQAGGGGNQSNNLCFHHNSTFLFSIHHLFLLNLKDFLHKMRKRIYCFTPTTDRKLRRFKVQTSEKRKV